LRSRIIKYLTFYLLIVTRNFGFAQDLCNSLPPGAVKGAFEIVGNLTSGCTPLNVKVRDLSGAEEVHYFFDYRNENSAQLDWWGSKDSSGAIINITDSPKDYRIIQYGKKNGVEMFACKTVTVLPKPRVSYTQCNNFVTVYVPNQTLNNGFNLNYKLGTDPEISLSASQLPYNSGPKTVVFPLNLDFYFRNNTGQKLCEVNQTITLNAFQNPNRGNISLVEMLTPTEASIEFSGVFDPSGYEINLHEKYSPSPPVLLGSKIPGKYKFSIPDSSKSYCFSVSRTEICGGTERSSMLCTIPFDPISPGPASNTLNWVNPPINLNNSAVPLPPVFGYINVHNTIKTKVNNSSLLPEIILPTEITKTYSIDCKKDYCYQINSVSEGVFMNQPFKGVTKSLERCISRKTMLTPPINDLLLNVNDSNKIEIVFSDDSGWNLNKSIFHLIKIDQKDSLQTDSLIATPFIFKPTQVDPSKDETCFRIQYTDICGSKSVPSASVCNILLKVDKSDDLSWNHAKPFSNELIDSYEVLEYKDNDNQIGNQYPLSKTVFGFDTKLDAFNTEAKFRLKAISPAGKESHSNIVSILITPLFFAPDAISVDANSINDAFEVKGRFGRVKSSQLEVYNRWGEVVFSGPGKEWNPDGNMPSGTYFYKILITLNDNSIQTKAGKIELIR